MWIVELPPTQRSSLPQTIISTGTKIPVWPIVYSLYNGRLTLKKATDKMCCSYEKETRI